MERKSYITAVDLGSSNVVVAVAAKQEEGLELKALVSKPVQGVRAGQIDNIEQVSQAVVAAITEAGAEAGIRITEAYAGVSGEFVRCARHTDYVFVANPQNGVSEQDVRSLFDRMRNLQAPEKEVIMEHIPQNYLVDDEQEVLNPIGSFGRKLSSTFNFVLCGTTPMERIEMALKRAGVLLAGVLPNTLAVPEAVLTPDEKEEGVAVIDIGGGVTDITVYYRNVVRYVASIPIGSIAINHDIRTMGVPERYVESLKQKYGSAVAERVSEEKLIRVTGRTARESRDILLRNLATVIESRAMDIVDFVKEELKISGYENRLAYGLVLTGGSANLNDLDELFRIATKMEVRVAVPEIGITADSLERVADPAYATIVGLMLKGAERNALGTAYIPDARAAQKPMPVQTPAAAPSHIAAPAEPKPLQTPVVPPMPAPMPTPAPATPAPATPAVSTPASTPVEKPYVPAVEPIVQKGEPTQPVEEETEEPVAEKKQGGFFKFLGKLTEMFESPGDEEI